MEKTVREQVEAMVELYRKLNAWTSEPGPFDLEAVASQFRSGCRKLVIDNAALFASSEEVAKERDAIVKAVRVLHEGGFIGRPSSYASSFYQEQWDILRDALQRNQVPTPPHTRAS